MTKLVVGSVVDWPVGWLKMNTHCSLSFYFRLLVLVVQVVAGKVPIAKLPMVSVVSVETRAKNGML